MHDLQHYLKRLRLSDQVPAGANQPEHAENLEEHVYMYTDRRVAVPRTSVYILHLYRAVLVVQGLAMKDPAENGDNGKVCSHRNCPHLVAMLSISILDDIRHPALTISFLEICSQNAEPHAPQTRIM